MCGILCPLLVIWQLNSAKFASAAPARAAGGFTSVAFAPEQASELYQKLKQKELRKRPLEQYLETNQEDLTPEMRSILVAWMAEVADEYKLYARTLMLSVAYVDAFLSKESARNTKKEKLQLVGVTAMLLASKFEEVYPRSIDDFVYITDHGYKREELLAMEMRLLETLLYEVNFPTVHDFLSHILMGIGINDIQSAAGERSHKTSNQMEQHGTTKEQKALIAALCAYLAELAILDYAVVTKFLPSAIASSCVLLSNLILVNEEPSQLQSICGGFKPYNLRECCGLLIKNLQKASAPKAVSFPIYEKYSSPSFKQIAKHATLRGSANMASLLSNSVFDRVS